MKSRIVTLMLLTGILAILINNNDAYCQDYSFRKVHWGDSRKKVKASESLKLLEEGDLYVAYELMLNNKKTALSYWFINDTLVSSRYFLIEQYSNSNSYIFDYNSFKDILTKKYGKPSRDEVNWLDDTYQDDPNDYGMAVSVGDLNMVSEWQTDTTIIVLGIYGNNYEIYCQIDYVSKEHKPLIDKATEQQNMNDF